MSPRHRLDEECQCCTRAWVELDAADAKGMGFSDALDAARARIRELEAAHSNVSALLDNALGCLASTEARIRELEAALKDLLTQTTSFAHMNYTPEPQWIRNARVALGEP